MANEWKREEPVTWKENLCMAVLLACLLLGWLALGGAATTDAQDFLKGKRPPGAYLRREKKAPLSPARFVGQTARAYQIANEIPDILDQLYCYCGCDRSLGHKSLLSCFTDDHGAG